MPSLIERVIIHAVAFAIYRQRQNRFAERLSPVRHGDGENRVLRVLRRRLRGSKRRFRRRFPLLRRR